MTLVTLKREQVWTPMIRISLKGQKTPTLWQWQFVLVWVLHISIFMALADFSLLTKTLRLDTIY